VTERVGLADVTGRLTHHDHQLGLVVELLGAFLRHPDDAAVTVERGVVLVEEDRGLGHRIARLGRVLAVVEPDANDLLGIRYAGAVLDLVLGQEHAAAWALSTRRCKACPPPRWKTSSIVVGAFCFHWASALFTSRS